MTENNPLVASRATVSGLRDDTDVKAALQELFDVFTQIGVGQATFEMREDGLADLFMKHLPTVTVERQVIDAAIGRAGDFHVVDGPHPLR